MAKKEESKKPRKSLFGLSPQFEAEVEPEQDKPKPGPEEEAPASREPALESSQAETAEPVEPGQRKAKPRKRSRRRSPKKQEQTPEPRPEDAPGIEPDSTPRVAREPQEEPGPEPAVQQPPHQHASPQPSRGSEQERPVEPPKERPGPPARQSRPGETLREKQQERVVQPKAALPEVSLSDLPPAIGRACERAGWSELTPVQSRAIPYLLKGVDLMVQSRTGSGKTGAFVLPMIDLLERDAPGPQALVLVPTRELAVQVEAAAHMLFGDEGLRSVAVYGGVPYGPQLEAFRRGVHLVVGTPGRILDHLLKRALNLDSLRILVFDEADRMLSMGFYPDMQRIRRYLPDRPVRGSMFSATYPPHVIRLSEEFLRSPGMLSLSRDHVHVTEIDHVFSVVPPMEKDRVLVRFVEMENPVSAIVFCNTKADVHYVTVVLQRFGHNADELSSDLAQSRRGSVLESLRTGRTRILVATDVAARGIDIPEISHVFQYGPPEDPELYIHRAGRTGRAGASGKAVTLVSGMEKLELQRTVQKFGIDMREVEMPTEEEVSTMVSERMIALLEARLRTRDRIQLERLRRFVPLVRELGRQEEDPLVLAMLLDEIYQDFLKIPPDAPVATEPDAHKEDQPEGEARKGKGRKRRPRRKKPAQPNSEAQPRDDED
jgi:ATP-dependent RNA helicase DeaD